MIFAEPPGDAPTYTTIDFDGGAKTMVHSMVLSTDQPHGRPFRFRLRIIGSDRDGGPLPSQTTNTFEQTVEMAGANRRRLASGARRCSSDALIR
jgi:hypothetical protein